MLTRNTKKLPPLDDLLVRIDGIGEAQRGLWLEVYRNAVEDRQRAEELYDDVFVHLKDDHTAHAIIGSQAAKYLERLNAANAQLLKLAELIQTALKSEADGGDADDIYDKIKAATDGR